MSLKEFLAREGWLRRKREVGKEPQCPFCNSSDVEFNIIWYCLHCGESISIHYARAHEWNEQPFLR